MKQREFLGDPERPGDKPEVLLGDIFEAVGLVVTLVVLVWQYDPDDDHPYR